MLQAYHTGFKENTIQHNHERKRENEVPGMFITINAIESCTDIPDIMTGVK